MVGFEYDICVDIERWKLVSQDSPYHSMSIGNHMLAACDYIKDKTDDVRLITAALLHDCAKDICKSFQDSRGVITSVAHYYGTNIAEQC